MNRSEWLFLFFPLNDNSNIQSDHTPALEATPTSASDVAIPDVIQTRPFSTGLIEFGSRSGVDWMQFRIFPHVLPKKTQVSGIVQV